MTVAEVLQLLVGPSTGLPSETSSQLLPAASAALYAWLLIDDELMKVANSLPEFLLGWIEGQISV